MKGGRDYKSESVREFNRSAEKYDHRSPFYYRMTRLCDDAVIVRLSGILQPTDRLLDVGCGTGALLEKLRQAFPEVILEGVDISSKMLEVARTRNISNATFTEGDSESLPFSDGSFEIVTCCSSFHHYPHPQKALSEFYRILKPGGHLIICDMNLPAIARLFANHLLFRVLHKGDVRVYTRKEMAALLENAGFSQCRVEKITTFEWLAMARR